MEKVDINSKFFLFLFLLFCIGCNEYIKKDFNNSMLFENMNPHDSSISIIKEYQGGSASEKKNNGEKFTFYTDIQGEIIDNFDFYDNGRLKSYDYIGSDFLKKTGPQFIFYSNGHVYAMIDYVNNKMTGESLIFNKKGKLTRILLYKNFKIQKVMYDKYKNYIIDDSDWTPYGVKGTILSQLADTVFDLNK